MDTPLLVLEHLTGDILGQPRPVAVVVVKVIVKELDDLRLEADKAVGRPGMIGSQANVLHDGIAAEDGFIEGERIHSATVVLLVVQADAQGDVAELHRLRKYAVQRQELLMVAHFDVKEEVHASILGLDNLADRNLRIARKQSFDLFLIGVPGGFQFQIQHFVILLRDFEQTFELEEYARHRCITRSLISSVRP